MADFYHAGTCRCGNCRSEPAPTPAPTPPRSDLATTDWANLWVYIFDNPTDPGYLAVEVYPYFDTDPLMFDVFVDGTEYCNPGPIYADGRYTMGCFHEQGDHAAVQQVSARIYRGGSLDCARNIQSNARQSVFACRWR